VDEGGLGPVPGAHDPHGLEVAGLTALLHRLGQEHHRLIDAVAGSIGAALPDQVRVTRRGLFNTGRARAVEIHLGEQVFELRHEHGQVTPRIGTAVGGVVIARDTYPIDAWLAHLGAALTALARRSADVAAALGRLA
jgi:hypothetical protein